MATLRQWLTDNGYDFEDGLIVYQKAKSEAYSPGWAGAHELEDGRIIPPSDPILDHEFDSGYGSPQAPRIIASDREAIYFIAQYDGSTWMEKIFRDLRAYCQPKTTIPYPGG